jgi:hypothetical protein
VLHGGHRLSVLGGVPQDLIVRHNVAFHLVEHHLPPELDRLPSLVAKNRPGMRLDQAHHLLPLEHAPARLADHLLHQRQQALGLRHQAGCQGLGSLAQVLDALLGCLDQPVILLLLFRFFLFSIAMHLAMDGLGRTPRRPQERAAELLHPCALRLQEASPTG